MALETSYTSRSAGSPGGSTGTPESDGKYWSLGKLRKAFTHYTHTKREEMDEQVDARRYYNASQYTDEQVAALKKRKQPIMTYNRVARKINAVVGQLEKIRQDPKAYARTPQHEEGAELATAVLRFVLDENDWQSVSSEASFTGAVDGIGGVEIDLKQGDKGDPDIRVDVIDTDAFFYDPRSKRADFSDAQYMGTSRMMDEDIAREIAGDVDLLVEGDDELSKNTDWENRWFHFDGEKHRVRIVELWYRHKGKWCWSLFTGAQIIREGTSPFVDEDGKPASKYLMFSATVDQDGDRYGFVRNLKSPQDGINARQSKMQHILASNKLFLTQGVVTDVERARAEYARPDGVILSNLPVNEGVKEADRSFDFAGWTKMFEQSVAEIEGYGINTSGLMEGEQGKSGRAIALLQAAGLAELGPYILAYRGWKVRVYRAVWNAVQKHWQSERWVRVTDDEGLAQFLSINQLGIDPQTGQPALVNAIGSLDVDIVLDEGPDTVNMMQDMYETLSNIVPALAPVMPPVVLQSLVSLFVQSSPLPASAKKAVRDAMDQAAQQGPPPDPEVEKAKMMAELKAQEQQQAMQLKQAETASNIQMKREEMAVDLEMQQQKHAMEMQNQAQKNQMDMETQLRQSDMEMGIERERGSMEIEHQRKKDEMAIATEQDKVAAKTGSPTSSNMKSIVNEFAEAKQEMREAMQALSSLGTTIEQLKKPRKQRVTVKRDANNRIVGADVDEAA